LNEGGGVNGGISDKLGAVDDELVDVMALDEDDPSAAVAFRLSASALIFASFSARLIFSMASIAWP
jgi:hypothetical protein